jgi:spore coat polysaccharide biosynthesis protein SpsF
MADLAGAPMLQHVISRVMAARTIDEVVVATTSASRDDEVAMLAAGLGVQVFRGSEDDVLGRYHGAASAVDAGVIVRVTADCPLLDPAVIDVVVDGLCISPEQADYASNVIDRTYPRGMDVEALFRDTLDRVHRRAQSAAAREHVTHFILREQPALFTVRSIVDAADNSDLRWTVDEPADLDLVRLIYRELDLAARTVPYRDVLTWARQHPAAAALNAHVAQKA